MKINDLYYNHLVKIAQQYRTELEEYFSDNDYWSVGFCRQASKELAKKLTDLGYSAKAVMGTYVCCDDEYADVVATHNSDFDPADLEDFDGTWKHWWVTVGNYIIDVTADQFHPQQPSFNVIVTTDHRCYK